MTKEVNLAKHMKEYDHATLFGRRYELFVYQRKVPLIYKL
jgi:hypothetical protein